MTPQGRVRVRATLHRYPVVAALTAFGSSKAFSARRIAACSHAAPRAHRASIAFRRARLSHGAPQARRSHAACPRIAPRARSNAGVPGRLHLGAHCVSIARSALACHVTARNAYRSNPDASRDSSPARLLRALVSGSSACGARACARSRVIEPSSTFDEPRGRQRLQYASISRWYFRFARLSYASTRASTSFGARGARRCAIGHGASGGHCHVRVNLVFPRRTVHGRWVLHP